MFRLITTLVLTILLISCLEKNKIGVKEYLRMTSVENGFDSILTISNRKIYYKSDCSILYEHDEHKISKLIFSKFINELEYDFEVNPNAVLIRSKLLNNYFEYELFDSLNGYRINKGILINDSLTFISIRSKNKKCTLYKEVSAMRLK